MRKSFSDIGATTGEYFGVKTIAGESFLPSICCIDVQLNAHNQG